MQQGVVRAQFRLVAPYVPIQSFGDRLPRLESPLQPGKVVADDDRLDRPGLTGADEFAGVPVDGNRALLAARLKNAVVLACGGDQRAPFLDREGDGFFGVNI